jgi:ankyrin repeat protein
MDRISSTDFANNKAHQEPISPTANNVKYKNTSMHGKPDVQRYTQCQTKACFEYSPDVQRDTQRQPESKTLVQADNKNIASNSNTGWGSMGDVICDIETYDIDSTAKKVYMQNLLADIICDIEICDTDSTPDEKQILLDSLSKAVTDNDETAILKFIKDNPSLVNCRMPGSFNTLLHVLLKKGNMNNIISTLIDISDIHERGDSGYSYLHCACEHKNNHEVIKKLLKAGIDINAKDGQGKTPINQAVFNQDEDTVNLLISLGADLTLKSRFDSDLLDDAIYKKNYSIVHTLLKHGCKLKPKSESRYPKTFLEDFFNYAQTNNDSELMQLILNT